jgi:general stress protein YciG
MTDKPKQRRGFAAMAPEKLRAIAAKGGASVPADKRSFRATPGLAQDAGRKGGLAVIARRGFAGLSPEEHRERSRKGGMSSEPGNRPFSKTPGLAKEAGRKGNKGKPRRIFPPGTFL